MEILYICFSMKKKKKCIYIHGVEVSILQLLFAFKLTRSYSGGLKHK